MWLAMRAAAAERGRARDAFAALSAEALRRNNESFLQLAETKLGELHHAAAGDLDARRRAVDELVRPLRDSLARVDGTLHEVELARTGAYAALLEQVKAMAEAQHRLHAETGNLVKALRAPQRARALGRDAAPARGGDGGDARVLRFRGAGHRRDDGRAAPARPRRQPPRRQDAWWSTPRRRSRRISTRSTAPTAERAKRCSADHARQVRDHIVQLGGKSYWSSSSRRPTSS